MLQVHEVCKTFAGGRGALEVLRDIRFSVSAGEFVSIIGPSGCGKTTLLRILHGLEPTTSGMVSVLGQRVQAPSPSSAIVFQQFNLFPWLTIALDGEGAGPRARARPRGAAAGRALRRA